MTRHITLIASLFFILSCNSNTDTNADNDSDSTVVEDTVYESANAPGLDSSVVIKNVPDIWTADFEEATNTYKIHKPANARMDTLSGEKLISLINVNSDSIHLNFDKISHDTIYVSIPDSHYLTQNIGSTGAENYMAATTFSLTEVKGIKFVHYKFTEGDHASPGVYSRNDFKDLQ